MATHLGFLEELGRPLFEYGQSLGITFEGGAAEDKKLLLFTLVHLLGAKLVYETGFNAGGAACCIAEALHHFQGKYVGFEISERRRPVIEEFHRRFPGNEVVMGNSAATLPARWEATQERPDLFFVDGDHTEAATKRDLQHAVNIVRPGGIVMVDDIRLPPVRKALISVVPEKEWVWFDGPHCGPGSCIYQVA